MAGVSGQRTASDGASLGPPFPELLDLARASREHSIATYSNFPVGAALRTTQGRTYVGCSVENASFPLSVCAERAALTAAAVAGALTGGESVTHIVVVGPEGRPCSPCGACRQWFVELTPQAVVAFRTPESLVVEHVADLLPRAFLLP